MYRFYLVFLCVISVCGCIVESMTVAATVDHNIDFFHIHYLLLKSDLTVRLLYMNHFDFSLSFFCFIFTLFLLLMFL